MWKLRKYYKAFILPLIVAIVLLFTQAMCDLKLPDYMSDIVNVGIQSSGIAQIAPNAITENGFELMSIFMSNEDREFVESNYTKVNKEDPDYAQEYAVNSEKTIYVLNKNLTEETVDKISNIFAISSRTMLNVLSNMTQENMEYNNENENFDIEKFYSIMPMLSNMPEEVISEARNQAIQTPESMLDSIRYSFYKGIL